MKQKPEQITSIPNHIAIIMDGNGRWAKKRFLHRNFGHREGVRTVERTIGYCLDYNVSTLTLYAFSTENWNRPKEEIEGLFKLIGDFFDSSAKKFEKNNVRIKILGSRENLSNELMQKIEKIEQSTQNNNKLLVNICFNYGGRQEIIAAIKDMTSRGVEICEQELEKSLYTSGVCDPDLIIRTSGEKRISNFLLYQSAYSELCFIDCLWPDFDRKQFELCLLDYSSRQRRFGKV